MIAVPVAIFHQSKSEELSMATRDSAIRLFMASWNGIFHSQMWSENHNNNNIINNMIIIIIIIIIIITFIRLSMYKFLILFRLSVTCQTLYVLAEKINSQMFKNSKSFVSQKIYANIVGCDKITIAIFSKCLTLD